MTHHHSPMKFDVTDSTGDLTQRIRRLINAVALDCDCRQRVNDALKRFNDQEQSRHDRRCLLDARQRRASIASLVALLGELESVSWQEADRSVFVELAHIFDDIAQLAMQGSVAMLSISPRNVKP